MALTVSAPAQRADVFGRHRVQFATVTFDSSYATGGEALDPHAFGLTEIFYVLPVAVANGYLVRPNATHSTLMVFQGDNTNAAAAPAVEVANATNLSTVKADVMVVGI